jgi:predicted ArsR family transcriptional regulator
MALLSNVLEADVVRTGHLARGDGACCYEIRPKTGPGQ